MAASGLDPGKASRVLTVILKNECNLISPVVHDG